MDAEKEMEFTRAISPLLAAHAFGVTGLQHLPQFHAYGTRQPFHIINRDVALAALNLAYVGSMQSRAVGQFLL